MYMVNCSRGCLEYSICKLEENMVEEKRELDRCCIKFCDWDVTAS